MRTYKKISGMIQQAAGNSLFFDEHTSGLAMSHGQAGHWAYAELGRPGLSDEPYRVIKESEVRITYEQDALKTRAIMHFDRSPNNLHDYSLIITLYKGQAYIELNWTIHSKEADPWPEAGWLSFTFNVENPVFRAGRLGAVVDPAYDFIRGSNFDYFFLNTGIAVLDKNGKGYGISSPDVPGISLDRPGLWKHSGEFTPEKPNIFFNLYNNQCSTNFTEWIEGSWNTCFYIWGIEDYKNEKDLITPSEEFRRMHCFPA